MRLVGHTLYAPCLPERVRAATGITKVFGPWKLTPEQKQALRRFLGLAIELPPDIPVPDAFGEHQKKGLAFLLSRNGRAMLAMEMGTGKTWTVIECLKHYGVLDRTLVLAPKSVVSSWVRELRLRAPHVEPRVALESAKSEALSGIGPWLTNYETVRDGKLNPQLFDAASLDEASVLRGFGGTKTFREFMALFAGDRKTMNTRTRSVGLKYRFVATATPSPNDYIELLAYAAFLGIMTLVKPKHASSNAIPPRPISSLSTRTKSVNSGCG